ncbi:hypothetical protein J6590_026053 [Homalodisca vitripennis]|nr:hypothetical protein J6590_026053 [Homalodisca vitripennis]
MCLSPAIVAVTFCMTTAHYEVPHWQQQIPYNGIAHIFHAMYREMYIPFDSTNQTAGSIILQKMEKLREGAKELKNLADSVSEAEFHKKYLQPVRFMILRGRKQWKLINYRNAELSEKYGWDEDELSRFRDMYREILDTVNEMEECCNRRHVDLSDQ